MGKHFANAHWEGNLTKGKGKYTLKTSGFTGNLTYSSRFEDDRNSSSPEELIGAALASCYSMALANDLDKMGHAPEKIETSAEVSLNKTAEGFSITEIVLKTLVRIKGLEKAKFLETAEKTKHGCPVSRALTGTKIKLEAQML
jgi:osmotically inducible protein OsmC